MDSSVARSNRAWLLLACVASLAAWIPSSLTVFPPMAGYIYFPLSVEGLVPYRDYYMPVTPLTYWLVQGASHLGDVRIVYLTGALVLSPVLTISIYSLVRPLVSVRAAAALACFGSVSLITYRADPLGGWNSFVIVLVTAAGALLIRALTFTARAALGLSVCSGVVAALAVLAKQTGIIPLGFGMAVLTILSFTSRFRAANPRIDLVLVGSAVGFVAALAGFALWLALNDAVAPFVRDMTSFGGKNPKGEGVVVNISRSLFDAYFSPLSAAVLLAVVVWQLIVGYGVQRLAQASAYLQAGLIVLLGLSLSLLLRLLAPFFPLGEFLALALTLALLILSRFIDVFPLRPLKSLVLAGVVLVSTSAEF